MIPILFPAGTTDFTTNGLGRMADATDCTVVEERNGAYELTMTYPVTGVHFSDLRMTRILYAKPADGKDPQPFDIYAISKPVNGICEINAQHISYRTSFIPVSPFSAQNVNTALVGLKGYAAESCPFTFWTDKNTNASFRVEVPSSIRSLLGGQSGSILDVYGGEYEFDNLTVKLHSSRGSDRGVTLRYGKNIIDLTQEENIANTYTGIMPYWRGNRKVPEVTGSTAESTSVKNDTETTVLLPEEVLHSANASRFPFQRTIPLDLSSDFESEPTAEALRQAAQRYLEENNIGVPAVCVKVRFVPLWQTEEYREVANLERVNLCDTVTVEFPALDVSVKAKVVKTEYDVFKERYKSIEIGDARSNMAREVIKDTSDLTMKITEEKTFLQESIQRATDLLTGGLGGFFVIGTNANGQPNEILMMDHPDQNQAVNVIRINKNGIGFSNTGYDGPFRSAWTIDSHFVADFIDTGTLNANLIRTGMISDFSGTTSFRLTTDQSIKAGKAYYVRHQNEDGSYSYTLVTVPMPVELGSYYELVNSSPKNYWNLETGEFRLSAADVDIQDGSLVKNLKTYMEDASVLDQQKVFNALTNNGAIQGIYLQERQLYLNASYIATGILTDVGSNTTFNLTTGELTMNKGSISIGGRFSVSSTGELTCSGATIDGTIFGGNRYGKWIYLTDDGTLSGGNGDPSNLDNWHGYIDFSASVNSYDADGNFEANYKGIQIQGGILRINTYRIGVAQSTNVRTETTSGGTGYQKLITDIQDNGNGTITWSWKIFRFINGFMCTEL